MVERLKPEPRCTTRRRAVRRRHRRPRRRGRPRGQDQNLNRLRRIEGQVRGLQQMVEEERYCADILVADLVGAGGAARGRPAS